MFATHCVFTDCDVNLPCYMLAYLCCCFHRSLQVHLAAAVSFVTMLVAIGYKINSKLFLKTELGEKNILYSKVTLNSQVACYRRPLPRRHRYTAILWKTLMQQNVSD